MAKERYLVSTKKPGLEFKITGRTVLNAETQEVRLQLLGAHGVEFDRVVNPDILEKYGYRVEVRDDSPAAQG